MDEKATDDDLVLLSGDDEADQERDNPLLTGSFNLYEELRSQLVARGIPREQIAFIHEAPDDQKKARMFAAVREGTIRVLIGSTAKMGVGTNVQKHLVAMHHLDAPWRPADVEQRDGRILRQGNLNPEIQIFRYITKGTLDAYRWQTLNTKANFIAQIRAGARGVRTAEDIDSPLPEAATIKAAATGDPRIMEHAELSKEVKVLEAARRGHERMIVAAKASKSKTLARIEKLQTAIAASRDDCAHVKDITGDRFEVALTLGDQHTAMRDRRAAGQVILAHLLRMGLKHWGDGVVSETVGEISGFAMKAYLRRKAGALQVAVAIEGRQSYWRGEFFPLTADTDPLGFIRRFEGLLRSIPQFATEQTEAKTKAEADLPRLDRQIAAGAFPKQAQLDAMSARIAELEEQLQPKEQEQPMTNDFADEQWNRLDAETKAAVEAAIAEAENTGHHVSRGFGTGRVSAEPTERGIVWLVIGGDTGNTIARGERGLGNRLKPGEGEDEDEDERNAKADADAGEQDTAAALPSGAQSHSPLGTSGAVHLEALRAAGKDEVRFGNALAALRADAGIDQATAVAIASAYAEAAGDWGTREEALGAIETHFYGQQAATQSAELEVAEGRSAGR
jgi:hypothetical protein